MVILSLTLFINQEAECEKEKMDVAYQAQTNIADSSREFQMQKASYDQEVNARKAEAELSYKLQVKLLSVICCVQPHRDYQPSQNVPTTKYPPPITPLSSLNKSGLSFKFATKSVTQYIDLKQQLLCSCFAFITRSINQNTATKFSSAHNTAIFENHPIMLCEPLNECMSCMLMDCVSGDVLLKKRQF